MKKATIPKVQTNVPPASTLKRLLEPNEDLDKMITERMNKALEDGNTFCRFSSDTIGENKLFNYIWVRKAYFEGKLGYTLTKSEASTSEGFGWGERSAAITIEWS